MEWNRNLRDRILVAVLLAAITAAVYSQVANHEFLDHDDDVYVTENAVVQRGITAEGVAWAFTTAHANIWHPLTWFSHMLDCQAFGLQPGPHHLSSLLLHLLNTVLLFLVLEGMTKAFWRSAFVAALFALHPLHIESVAWIAERKDMLSTFFWFLTMGAYVLYARQPGIPRYLVVVLLLALGLMAKPMLVTLPVVFLLMDFWPLGRFSPARRAQDAVPPERGSKGGEQPRKGKREKKKTKTASPPNVQERSPWISLLAEKMPLLAIAAIFSVVAIHFQQLGGTLESLESYPIGIRISTAVVSYLLYAFKMFWPAKLAVFYPHPGQWPAWMIAAAFLFLVSVSALCIRLRRSQPYLLFGWLWFLVTLLPVIGLVKLGNLAIADRYTYVSLVGPFVMMAWGIPELATRLLHGHAVRTVPAALACLAVGALTLVSYQHIRHWRNTETLFSHALSVTENNFVAHNNLALALLREGRTDEALGHLQQAVAIKPEFALAHFNMGVVYAQTGRADDALVRMQQAARLDPRSVRAQYGLGSAYMALGRADEAIAAFQQALRIDGNHVQSMAGIADGLLTKGMYKEALTFYLRALALQPGEAKLQYNAGMILIQQGKVDEAIGHLREAIRLRPDYARAHNNLGSALLMKGKVDEAIRHFEEAVRIDPDYRIARENLRDALSQQKKGRK